jgi:hypothetical protein
MTSSSGVVVQPTQSSEFGPRFHSFSFLQAPFKKSMFDAEARKFGRNNQPRGSCLTLSFAMRVQDHEDLPASSPAGREAEQTPRQQD